MFRKSDGFYKLTESNNFDTSLNENRLIRQQNCHAMCLYVSNIMLQYNVTGFL